MKNEIDSFTIEVTLIVPIQGILNKLESGNFRDCDIVWLDEKLEKYTSFACETFGMKFTAPSSVMSERSMVLNDYMKNRYIQYFTTLRDYFKDLNK